MSEGQVFVWAVGEAPKESDVRCTSDAAAGAEVVHHERVVAFRKALGEELDLVCEACGACFAGGDA